MITFIFIHKKMCWACCTHLHLAVCLLVSFLYRLAVSYIVCIVFTVEYTLYCPSELPMTTQLPNSMYVLLGSVKLILFYCGFSIYPKYPEKCISQLSRAQRNTFKCVVLITNISVLVTFEIIITWNSSI